MRASWSQEEAISGPRIPGKALEDLKKALQGFTEQDERTEITPCDLQDIIPFGSTALH